MRWDAESDDSEFKGCGLGEKAVGVGYGVIVRLKCNNEVVWTFRENN